MARPAVHVVRKIEELSIGCRIGLAINKGWLNPHRKYVQAVIKLNMLEYFNQLPESSTLVMVNSLVLSGHRLLESMEFS